MAIAVDCDFPGGNVIVERIDGDRLIVRPDLRDTTTWWFWWNFRVRGAAGRTLRVEFPDERGPVGPAGAVMSADGGEWHWVDGDFSRQHFAAAVPAGAEEVRFAFSFPYQLADWESFAGRHRAHPDFRTSELVRTARGFAAPLAVVGDPVRAGSNVLLACRHHACEAPASFVLEGVIEELLAPERAALRRSAAFSIVPFVDLDGTEAGDQGKNRRPHDHNRDYTAAPLYPTVRAIEDLVADLAGRNLALYVDCHCPWLRDGRNEAAFLVEPEPPWHAEAATFREILRRTPTGPVPYTGRMDIAYGTEWNTGVEPTSWRYLLEHGGPGMRTAIGLEFSYSLTEGARVTPKDARQFGRGLARAIGEYLNQPRAAGTGYGKATRSSAR